MLSSLFHSRRYGLRKNVDDDLFGAVQSISEDRGSRMALEKTSW